LTVFCPVLVQLHKRSGGDRKASKRLPILSDARADANQ
jgi:hypothetical protein